MRRFFDVRNYDHGLCRGGEEWEDGTGGQSYGAPTKSDDFVGRGGARDRAQFSPQAETEPSGLCDDEGGADPVEPTEPPATPEPNPFTPDGQGTMVDNATDGDGKEFFTIMAADESVFYLVIDRQRETENVYFLNAVTVANLMALAEPDQEPVPEPLPTTEPDTETDPEPEVVESEPEKSGGAGVLLAVLGVLALGGGAGWYFKIYRPKQQQAAGPGEDYDEAEEYADDFDGGDYNDNPPWDEDETEGGE